MWVVFAVHDDVISPQTFGPFRRGSDAAACKYVIEQHEGWGGSLFEMEGPDAIEQVLAAAKSTDDAEWLRSHGF